MNTLDEYKECGILDSNGRVSLVLRGKRVYVRKIVDVAASDIYRRLRELNSDYFPKIKSLVNRGDYYVVIEQYISGCTLGEYIRDNGVLDEETARGYICEVLKAVELLHKRGIIHRDITENNVMLTDEGKIKIIDFNISHRTDRTKSKDTVVMGTNGYAAPEQFGFSRCDERTDIYAIGVLLNYMLMGCTELGMYGGSRKYVKIIEECTAFEPGKRYSSCSEVMAELGLVESLYKERRKKFGNALFWVVAAITGFFYIGCITDMVKKGEIKENLSLMTSSFFLFILPFPIICNWWDWQSYTPLKHWNEVGKRLASIAIYIFVLVTYVAIIGKY
jgi:serine/threonine protein kinase